jgi:hypothetical protein
VNKIEMCMISVKMSQIFRTIDVTPCAESG